MYIYKAKTGFTIVELLIVIVVIGILAGITIVAYNGVAQRAKVSAAQSGVTQAVKKIEAYAVTNNDTYPYTLEDAGLVDTDSVSYQYVVNNGSNPKTYCISTTTQGVSYYDDSTLSTMPAEGKCTISNIVTNPSFKTDVAGWSRSISGGMTVTGTRVAGQTTPIPGISTAYRLEITAGSGSYWRTGITLPAMAGHTYQFSAYARANTNMDAHIALQWRDAGGALISATYPTFSLTTDAWTRMSVGRTAPAGTASILYQLGAPSSAPVGTKLDFTGVMLSQGQSLYSYADGDLSGWGWSGTPNNSQSSGKPL